MCYCFPIFQRTFCYSLRSPSVFVGSAKVEAIFDLTKKLLELFPFLACLVARFSKICPIRLFRLGEQNCIKANKLPNFEGRQMSTKSQNPMTSMVPE
jgi:hypothetical protein